MSDRDALLHAIAARPEEDTPRLMYADWLEENGEPERADFVRTQVHLAQPGLTREEQFQLVRKNVAYMKGWTRQWKDQLPRVPGIEWGDFNRGLIEEVQANDERPVVVHAAEIFAVPGVHILRLRRLVGGLALADCPELERLRALRMVSARATAPHLRALLASPHLQNLKVLDLHGNGADDGVAGAIADGRFPHLTELWLGSNAIGSAGAHELTRSPHLAGLQLLDLRGNAHISAGAQAALKSKFGKRVKL
jgi:uncharacterized protein (TIGR02996 family)